MFDECFHVFHGEMLNQTLDTSQRMYQVLWKSEIKVGVCCKYLKCNKVMVKQVFASFDVRPAMSINLCNIYM